MTHRYAVFTTCLLISSWSNAQTGILNSNEMLPIGSSYVVRTVQDPSMVTLTTGTGVVWNMTTLVPTGPDLDVDILAPQTTQYGSNFPQSNYCMYESSIPRYSYFDLNASSFSRIGFWRNQLGTYSDAQTEYVFPVQMGSMNSDTWANNTVSFPGTYDYEVVGTGTLHLPGATYTDVLLIRVVSTNLIDFVSYQWVSAQNGAYLMLYFEPSAFLDEGAQMITSLQVGLNEVAGGIDLRVHAPSNGVLPISYTANEVLSYRLYDVTGRQVKQGILPATTDPRTEMLDVTMLRTGIHLIELTSSTSQNTARFLIDQ